MISSLYRLKFNHINVSSFQRLIHTTKHITKENPQEVSDFNVVTFNLLAPCYKRMKLDSTGSSKYRESEILSKWLKRASGTLEYFNKELYNKGDIIALQEFWLEDEYCSLFLKDFKKFGYELHYLQRTGSKKDSVALAINKSIFEIKGRSDVTLCLHGDRVALILWLYHKKTEQNIIVANTHLSFPHSIKDEIRQVKQVEILTNAINVYTNENNINGSSQIIAGDFNVELQSQVCCHLKSTGLFNSVEILSPDNSNITNGFNNRNTGSINNGNSIHNPIAIPIPSLSSNSDRFVSHRNHRFEELGVDHIFYKPSSSNELFINSTSILPSEVSCNYWDDSFQISDHRPFYSSFKIGKKNN
jgi:mRNA deadenylase 3'-5' endonuclease subunit Ccr4